MPENNNNKDPIEHLFRKKAEEYDISYQEADWLELEKRLDKQQHQSMARRKRWLVAAVILFLFSLLGYAVYQNYQEINKLNEELENQRIVEIPRSDHTEGNTDSESAPADEDIPDHSATEEEPPSYASETESHPNKAQKNPSTQPFVVSDVTIPQLTAADFSSDAANSAEYHIQSDPTDLALVQPDDSNPDMAAREGVTDALSPSAGRSGRQSMTSSRVSIGFLAGPDLSTVGGFSDFHQPGYNLGLLAEYRLTSNLSIRSGLLRSSVNYQAGGDEYHPPGGFWSYDTAPYQTTAQCLILDIPVSLKYDFWHFDRSTLYATAGFNSYIMLNEEYQFDYESYSNQLVQEWNGRTGTSHWLSNASFSIGYAFALNSRLNMQIEPFLKLPMRDVGWGNVKLYSTGASVSFNYHLH